MQKKTIRILHIARYRAPSMERKLELMAAQPDLAFWLVRPAIWQDEYGKVAVNPVVLGCPVLRVPMLGRTNDPHRALYRTLTFGMRAIRPHIIYVEAEPDSLAALQTVLPSGYSLPRRNLFCTLGGTSIVPKLEVVREEYFMLLVPRIAWLASLYPFAGFATFCG